MHPFESVNSVESFCCQLTRPRSQMAQDVSSRKSGWERYDIRGSCRRQHGHAVGNSHRNVIFRKGHPSGQGPPFHSSYRYDLTLARSSARLDLQTHRFIDVYISGFIQSIRRSHPLHGYPLVIAVTLNYTMAQVGEQSAGSGNVQAAVRASVVSTLSAPLYGCTLWLQLNFDKAN